MAYSQTKYHLVVIRFAIVCLTIGMFCFLTGVSLRSLDVLRNPSICFGGNNYEIRFSFVVSKEKLLVLKKYASRTLWKTQTPHLADETPGRCIEQCKQTVTEGGRATNRFAGPILAVMRHADRVRIHKGTQWAALSLRAQPRGTSSDARPRSGA